MKKALQNKYINIHYHLINLQKNKMKQENIPPRSLYFKVNGIDRYRKQAILQTCFDFVIVKIDTCTEPEK